MLKIIAKPKNDQHRPVVDDETFIVYIHDIERANAIVRLLNEDHPQAVVFFTVVSADYNLVTRTRS